MVEPLSEIEACAKKKVLVLVLFSVVSDRLGPLGHIRGVPCPKVLYTRPGQLWGGTRIRRSPTLSVLAPTGVNGGSTSPKGNSFNPPDPTTWPTSSLDL